MAKLEKNNLKSNTGDVEKKVNVCHGGMLNEKG